MLSKTEIDELSDKYSIILRLRLAQRQDDPRGPRAEMAALAFRFPGALRELDELPFDDLNERIAMLKEATLDSARVAPWMIAIAGFHSLSRGALSAKKWLSGRKHVDDTVRANFIAERDSLDFPEDALRWQNDLAAVARPPGGRLSHVIFIRLAVEMGTTAANAKRLAFSFSRRSRSPLTGL